jgi:hypothetical protein
MIPISCELREYNIDLTSQHTISGESDRCGCKSGVKITLHGGLAIQFSSTIWAFSLFSLSAVQPFCRTFFPEGELLRLATEDVARTSPATDTARIPPIDVAHHDELGSLQSSSAFVLDRFMV